MPEKEVVRTGKAPPPTRGAPYSQGIAFGDLVFVAGQLPIDPATGEVVPGGIAEHTARVMQNIGAVLEAAGSRLENMLKTTVFIADRALFAEMNEVYRRYVGHDAPARSTIQVDNLPYG